jgi:hypothetical protein
MGFFRRPKEPAPKMVPGNMTASMLETFGLVELLRDAPVCGADPPEWITEEEAARRRAEEDRNRPTVAELLQDPDVRAVVEAFTGEAVVLDLLAES